MGFFRLGFFAVFVAAAFVAISGLATSVGLAATPVPTVTIGAGVDCNPAGMKTFACFHEDPTTNVTTEITIAAVDIDGHTYMVATMPGQQWFGEPNTGAVTFEIGGEPWTFVANKGLVAAI